MGRLSEPSSVDACIACGRPLPPRVLVCPACGALNTRRETGVGPVRRLRIPWQTVIVRSGSPQAFIEFEGHYLYAGRSIVMSKSRWIATSLVGIVGFLLLFTLATVAWVLTGALPFLLFALVCLAGSLLSLYVFVWSLRPLAA